MAKICIICEGNYPYVTGGVSSWVDHLIKMSKGKHEFYIVALIPNQEFAKMKYELPENVIEVVNIVLNQFEVPRNKLEYRAKITIDLEIKERVEQLLNFNELTSEQLIENIEFFSKYNKRQQLNLVLNETFWEGIVEYYNKNKFEKGLNLFYWTYRNLFLNLISLGIVKLPEADIYHSVSTGYAGILTALVNYRKKGKTLITEHGIYSREREEDILGSSWIDKKFKEEWIGYFNTMCEAGYKYSDKVVTLFEYNRQYEISHGADEKITAVIPNGIDVEEFSSLEKYKKESFSIGSVLRVVPIKDIKMMLKGFKIVASRIKNIHLYIIGPTDENKEYYEECVNLMDELELNNRVTFTGKTDVKEYYKFLDLFILTSILEGQPLSVLEALASKIPCITTDVGDCREILTEKTEVGQAGMVVSPTSYRELAKGIINLYNDKEKREQMGENGLKIVEKYYKNEYFEKSYEDLYETFVQKE